MPESRPKTRSDFDGEPKKPEDIDQNDKESSQKSQKSNQPSKGLTRMNGKDTTKPVMEMGSADEESNDDGYSEDTDMKFAGIEELERHS